MPTIIKEKDIKLFSFVHVAFNFGLRWNMELPYIIDNDSINKEIDIIFETNDGSKKVKTTIVDVINNYVKIRGDVMIPLNSISNINYTESTATIKNNNPTLKIIFTFLFTLICIAIIVYFIIK